MTTSTPQQTILVVDDERFIVSLLTEILEEEGYLVRVASDGEAALQEIATIRPDLVVADIMMPRLDGLTLAATLRSWPLPIPVILMSAAVTPRSHGVVFHPQAVRHRRPARRGRPDPRAAAGSPGRIAHPPSLRPRRRPPTRPAPR